jgi:hypothetical protein
MKKEKWLTGFKMLRKSKGKLRSWNFFDPEMTLRYSTRRETVPPFGWGPLAVFKTLEAARENGRTHRNVYNEGDVWLIYRCLYVPSMGKALYMPGASKMFKRSCPDGTIFAKKVRLTKKVS